MRDTVRIPGPGYRVAYSRYEWDRADAWAHLHDQQIPGCPKVQLRDGTWAHGWRKAHRGMEWGYVYQGLHREGW